jgi:phage portal protein BeeE
MFDNFFKTFFNSSKTNTITTSRDLEKAWFSVNNNTKAGMDVNIDTAMASTALFAAVSLLAESVAGLPLIMYKRMPDGSAVRFDDHPLRQLLTDSPNKMMNSLEFVETMMTHIAWHNCRIFDTIVTNPISLVCGCCTTV